MSAEQVYSDLLLRINGLQTFCEQMDDHLMHSLDFFLACIALVCAVLAGALYFLTKSLIGKGIQDAIEQQKKRSEDLESRIDKIQAASRRYRPTEYVLPLVDGIEANGPCCYSKNRDDLVMVTFSVKASSGELKPFPRIRTIAMLPAGFKPDKVISQTINDSLTIRIYTTGKICYDITSTFKSISCSSILFYASNEK